MLLKSAAAAMRKGRKMTATQRAALCEEQRKRRAVASPTVRLQKPNAGGYVIARLVNHPILGTCSLYEHQLVFVNELGRGLKHGEHVHHKNEIRHDNRRENLELMKSHKEHMARHPRAASLKPVPGGGAS
jgi:hypothetical protein